MYGNIDNFQGDHLKHYYERHNTRGKRAYEKVVIDEVDNMLLDNASHITMLPKKFSGFEHLNYFMRMCWIIYLKFDQQYVRGNNKLYWVERLLKNSNGKVGIDVENVDNIKVEVKNRLKHTVETLEPLMIYIFFKQDTEVLDDLGIDEGIIKPPKYLESFLKAQIKNWIIS